MYAILFYYFYRKVNIKGLLYIYWLSGKTEIDLHVDSRASFPCTLVSFRVKIATWNCFWSIFHPHLDGTSGLRAETEELRI